MTIHRRHLKHNKLDRNRRGTFAEFLESEATSKAMPERAIRDCFEDITVPGLTAAQIDAAANAGAAGIVTESLTLTLAQKAAASPTNLTFGEQVGAVSQSRSLKIGATTGSITCSFDATANTITRATGSFITDGFVVGGTCAISGAVDAGNNSSTPVITVVEALTLTFDDIAADETDDADVTISCVDTIRDVSGVAFALIPGFVQGVNITLSTTAANDGDYTVGSIDVLGTGAVLTAATLTIATDTTVTISVAAGDLDFGVLVDCLDAVDEFTFDRYDGTIVSRDDIDFDTLGFVVGGIIEVKSSLNNNGRYVLRAVTTDTLTVARATTGSITVTFAAGARGTATRSTGSFLTDGFRHGDFVNISAGAADATNRSTFEVIGVTALVLYLKDLPASETNDAGVTISTADLHDEVSLKCKVVQINTISNLVTTNIAVGSLLVGTTPAGQDFEARVTSITAAPVLLVSGAEFTGEADRTGTTAVLHANMILRAAGDWENDGFEAGEGIVIAGAGVGVDGGNVVYSTSDTQLYTVNPFTAAVTRDTDATVKGRALITRSAGDWATAGFALNKYLYLQDTKGADSGSITVDFDATANTITRATGSFHTVFEVGDKFTIAGAADAGNNALVPTVLAIDEDGLIMTVDNIAADETGDAGVTLTQVRKNDGYYRIKKVVSATVIEVQDTISPESATASVDAILINEKAA